MEKWIDLRTYPVAPLLDVLLQDKTTKKNIIWATDSYESLGSGFSDVDSIDRASLLLRADMIRSRIQKSEEDQTARTRKKAEVFTPAWLCNRMNNYCDQEWFGRPHVFNIEEDKGSWRVIDEAVIFPKERNWKEYVDSRRLEISCGEAPYLVSRYDVSTGKAIFPLKNRIGQLDRKLRIINENTRDYEEWLKWVIRAFQACYGYEYQGDSLLIARINLFLSFVEYYQERWEQEPEIKLLRQLANIIAWNLWQMDGLKDTVPLGKPYEGFYQLSLFDRLPGFSGEEKEGEKKALPCRIYNWRGERSFLFRQLKG